MGREGYQPEGRAEDMPPPSRTPGPSAGRAERARVAALLDAQSQFGDYVATLVGLRSQIESNGWTREQATAMVAYTWGWRPADGSKPEGVD